MYKSFVVTENWKVNCGIGSRGFNRKFLDRDSVHSLFTKDFSSWSETPMFVLPINWSNLFSFEVYICLHIFSLLLLQMLLVKWHNWKMPSKNIKSKRPNAKCTLLAKPPKLTAMKPTDLWPNKSMTFSGKKSFSSFYPMIYYLVCISFEVLIRFKSHNLSSTFKY